MQFFTTRCHPNACITTFHSLKSPTGAVSTMKTEPDAFAADAEAAFCKAGARLIHDGGAFDTVGIGDSSNQW